MDILRLKEVLAEKGVNGKELAKMVGVSQPAISEFVNNKSIPRKKLLLNIANALEVDLRELFISTKPQKSPQEVIRDAINNLEVVYTLLDEQP